MQERAGQVGIPNRLGASFARRLACLRLWPVQSLLILLLTLSLLFAYIRDLLAAGVPDDRSVPLMLYPGFMAGYSSGYLSVWRDPDLMLLFFISALSCVLIGVLVALLSSDKREAVCGFIAVVVLVLLVDIQVVYWPASADYLPASLICFGGGMSTYDLSRFLPSAALVGIGVALGGAWRFLRKDNAHSSSELDRGGELPRATFASCAQLAGVLLTLEIVYLFVRDLCGGEFAFARLIDSPTRLVLGEHSNGGNVWAGLISMLFLAALGFFVAGMRVLKRGGKWGAILIVLLLLIYDEISSAGFRSADVARVAMSLPLACALLWVGSLINPVVYGRRSMFASKRSM